MTAVSLTEEGGLWYRYYDMDLLQHGEQVSMWSNGKIRTLSVYHHGLLHGLQKMWDNKGNLLNTSNWSYGNLHGDFVIFDADRFEQHISFYDGDIVTYIDITDVDVARMDNNKLNIKLEKPPMC